LRDVFVGFAEAEGGVEILCHWANVFVAFCVGFHAPLGQVLDA
jgi:hypothetical protein